MQMLSFCIQHTDLETEGGTSFTEVEDDGMPSGLKSEDDHIISVFLVLH